MAEQQDQKPPMRYGVSNGGNTITLVLPDVSGKEPLTIELPTEVADMLRQMLTEAVSKAHDARTAVDPTYNKPGEVQLGLAKRVKALGTGVDLKKRAAILIVQNSDGTSTNIPIGVSNLPDIIAGLESALTRIQSGEKPKPVN